jgi:hypothetical protein
MKIRPVSGKAVTHPRRKTRKEDAVRRNETRRTRTSQQQLDLLKTRPGMSLKERKKLEEEILRNLSRD